MAHHLAQHRSPPHIRQIAANFRWIAANSLPGQGLMISRLGLLKQVRPGGRLREDRLPSFLRHSIKTVNREAAKSTKQKMRLLFTSRSLYSSR
jgi:hypothetical protein